MRSFFMKLFFRKIFFCQSDDSSGKKEDADEFALIDEMERISGVKIPQAIEEIRDAKILHNRQCKPEEMEETVKQTFSK